MEIPSELGGAVAPATMAGKMQDLGPITPDLVDTRYGYGVRVLVVRAHRRSSTLKVGIDRGRPFRSPV